MPCASLLEQQLPPVPVPSRQPAPELDEVGFITYNSLAPAAFLDNGDALNALAGDALDGATTDLVDSEAGRALLSYVVRCALATGASAAFPRDGAPDLVYAGQLGFATDWKGDSLDATGRRLMTGCLMAHVNAFETQVPISVRNAIVGDAAVAEKLLYSAQELAVYGNYFAPASERELYVCFGKAVALSLGALRRPGRPAPELPRSARLLDERGVRLPPRRRVLSLAARPG